MMADRNTSFRLLPVVLQLYWGYCLEKGSGSQKGGLGTDSEESKRT